MGNPFGSLWNDAKQAVGAGISDGAHALGDGLNAVGLRGAAQAVDTLGDKAGYDLGADVPELQLGQTSDPAELVHGDPAAIRSSASQLRTFSSAFGETANGLRGLDTAHWTGSAADAFRAKFAPQPAKWQDASSANGTTSGALESYAGAVEAAQNGARQAIDLYAQGEQATAAAQAAYNQQVAAYNSAAQAYNAQLAGGQNPGTPPTEPGPFTDPGEAMRQQAQQILSEARSSRDTAAASAAAAIRPATDLAPAEPSFLSQLGDDLSDTLQVSSLASVSFTGGVVDGAAGFVKFARSVDPQDPWNIEHPAEYAAGLSGTAAGLASDAINPEGLVKGLVGTGWGSDPFQAAGRLVPNIALAVGTDGAGTAADAGSVAESAAVASGESAVADAGSAAGRAATGSGEDAAARALAQATGDPGLAAVPKDDVPTVNDPIDVVTGDVILAQTDVALPGMLPLVVERMHRSSWRAGRWFGRSWVSTFDQRLQVDGRRVIGAFADGRVLVWPRPEDSGPAGDEAGGPPGGPALPVAGAPWPLRRQPDGGWTVSDPRRGLTWRFGRHSGYFCSSEGHGELPLVAVHDRAGHEITFGYDETGAPAWIRHSGGYHVRVTVAAGRVTGLAAGKADGAQLLRYSYDEDGNLAGVINSSRQPLLFRYDEASRLTGWRDRNSYGYGYNYDDQGRCVRGDGPGGVLSGTMHYDPQAQVTTSTDAAGAVTTYQLRGAYVVTMTDPLGHVSRWEHDERGQLTERTDPLGRVTRYTFDARGNLTTIARPDGSQAQAEYDERDLPVRLAEPGGHVWLQEYDARGNRTQVTAPDGAVTRFCYDDHGHLASITDPAGAVTLVACDAVGLPVRVTGANGAVTSLERDPLGRVTRITRPGGGIIELTWTPEGQPASRSLPDGTAEFWDYDAEGNLTRHLSPAGALTRYEYGPFDQLVARTTADGSRFQIGYDHALRMTSVRRAGLTWSYDYDLAGRLVAETDFNGATTSYEHDAGGQLIGQVNACGQRIAFCHDQLGNVAERTSGRATTTFGYDLAGRLVYARNPEAEIWLDRDPLGRIIAETCNGRTVTSEYDAAGRRRRRVTPFGGVTDWDYDQAGQLMAVTAGGHQIQFDYDEAGQEIRRELPGGLVLAQDWDQRGRLTAQSLTAWGQEQAALPEGPMAVGPAAAGGPMAGGPMARGPMTRGPMTGGQPVTGGRVLQRRAYAYNGDGLVTGIDDLLAGARRIGLDRSGRVTAVIGPDWAERYTYDPAGNLSAASWPAPLGAELAQPGLRGAFSVVCTENAPGSPAGLGRGAQGPRQVTGTLITRAGNVRYRHDRQGRVVQRQVTRISREPAVWQYEWDAGSRLTAVTTPDHITWRYRYDPFGRRIAKQRLTGDGSIAEQTNFVWDGPVLAEQATPAAQPGQYEVVTWDYRPGSFTALTQAEHTSAGEPGDLGEASQEQIDQRFYAIVADLVGTPAELVAPDGTLAGRQQHTLWGTTIWRPDGAQTPLRFPGQYADPETGLHYNQHRYYDPVAGSYLTPDPLGLAAAPNPHAYVPNPQVLADPLGLSPYADQPALPAGSPGNVVPNELDPHEVAQAQSIVDFQGGTFVGNTVKSAPGIDGYLSGEPVSLKTYSGSSPGGVLRWATEAQKSAANAGYSGVTLYIDAPRVATSRLLDFIPNGRLGTMTRQGIVKSIYVHTAGGWVVIP